MKGPDTSFRLLACRYVQEQTKTLLAHIDNIRGGDDIEYIHQARVASRRICTGLDVFEAAFPSKKVRRWNKYIRRLIKGLGAARDKDVQIEFVAGVVADGTRIKKTDLPGLKRLLLRLRQERDNIQPRVVKILDQFETTETLSEILAQTQKINSRLKKAGADLGSPFVLKQGARDIRKKSKKLLRFQSYLEDAEAVEQHHRMRIVAKKLRYTMEVYKKAFEKRLNKTIKVVRNLQTLLGDIHDCDVWCDDIRMFMEAERQRTIEYFGHDRPFKGLRRGLEYLKDERADCRRETFNELVAFWKLLQESGFWEDLLVGLKTLEKDSDLTAFRHVVIQMKKPVPDVEDVPEDPDSGEAGLIDASLPQTEPPEPLDEQESVSFTEIPVPDEEELPSCPPANDEAEAEVNEAISPVETEKKEFPEAPSHEEPAISDQETIELTVPDQPPASSAPPKNVFSSEILLPDEEELPSCHPADDEAEAEVNEAISPIETEKKEFPETPSHQEQAIPDQETIELTVPDQPPASSAPPKNVFSSEILVPDEEELPSCLPANDEAEAEVNEAISPVEREKKEFPDAPSHEEPAIPDHEAIELTTPDPSPASSAPPIGNDICECCGRNSFLMDELAKIDSGQFLCPECLDALHEKERFLD